MKRVPVAPLAIVVGLTSGLVGPRLMGPTSRPASEPFAYAPPEGFRARAVPAEQVEVARAWELSSEDALLEKDPSARPVVVVHHSPVTMQVDEPSLGKMASEMPGAFEDCTWTHRRHEMRVRADGAGVGLIEGDCAREGILDAGGDTARKLQLVFPETEGTSIATISFPASAAARWTPLFEATIDTAKGVATRVPPPGTAAHVAWGLAGLVIGGLLAALVGRK